MTILRNRRRAFVMLFALAIAALAVMLVAVVVRLTSREIARERTALLESNADTVLTSARAWSDVHAGELKPDSPIALPIDKLLTPDFHGDLNLTLDSAASRVRCHLNLDHGRESLHRSIDFPIPAAIPNEVRP